jgi:GNAT superfamily N-acetyltransferase
VSVETTTEPELIPADRSRDAALVGELVRLINRAYALGEAGLWLEGTARVEPAEVAEAIRAGGMLAVTVEGRLVGCAYMRPLAAGTGDLGLVSAAPEWWGCGMGRDLMRAGEELIRSRGMTTVQLELLVPKERVHPEKERLRAWYLRLGYRVVGSARVEEVAPRLAPRLATPCEFLVFRKTLT